MTCMRARTSSNFGLIGPPTAELAALDLYWGKMLYQILFILAGNDDIYKSFDEFEIRPDLIMDQRVSCS